MIAMRTVRLLLVLVLFFAAEGTTLQAGQTQQAQQPPSSPAAQPAASPSKTAVVWVNTTTGFYHQPSSRYYGKQTRLKPVTARPRTDHQTCTL